MKIEQQAQLIDLITVHDTFCKDGILCHLKLVLIKVFMHKNADTEFLIKMIKEHESTCFTVHDGADWTCHVRIVTVELFKQVLTFLTVGEHEIVDNDGDQHACKCGDKFFIFGHLTRHIKEN